MSNSLDKPDPSCASDLSDVRWQFIDSSKNSRANLTQVKRHVMQEYMRHKKSNRQSESEEERPQAKRGRPKKTRATKRRSEKQTRADSNGDSSRSQGRRLTTKQPVTRTMDLLNPESSKALVQNLTTSNALLNEFDTPLIVSLQDSHVQSAASPLSSAIDKLAERPSPNGQSLDSDLHNLSWSPTSTTSHQSINSPDNILGASRTEPFSSITRELDLDREVPQDFCVNEIPGYPYESSYRLALSPDWYTAAAVADEIQDPIPDTLLHEHHAGTVLQDHLVHPHNTSHVAIMSCPNAATLEGSNPRPENKGANWVQMRAVGEMIQARGGPAAFANTPSGMLINWQDHAPFGYEPHGPTSLYKYEKPTFFSTECWPRSTAQPIQALQTIPSSISSELSELSPNPEPRMLPSQPISSSIDEIKLQCEEFIDFLRRCEQLALFQREAPESSYTTRHTVVQETSILRHILASSPGSPFTPLQDRSQTISRLTTLIILNAALWDYRYTPSRAAIFLSTLEKALVNNQIGVSHSAEAILQILLECNASIESWPAYPPIDSSTLAEYPDFSQYYPTATSPSARPWFAGRMLTIATRLSGFSWYRISELLFSCLTLEVQYCSMPLLEADLRKEILGTPLAGYDVHSLI